MLGAGGAIEEKEEREKEQGSRSQETGEGGRGLEQEKPPSPLKLLRRRQKVILNGQASKWNDVTALGQHWLNVSATLATKAETFCLWTSL